MKEIAIIGGGASGLMAAIAAKRKDNSVTVYERGKRVGRKILATGNGRCNMTNIYAGIDDYHGGDTGFMSYAAEHFWVGETIEFFSRLGVLTKVEDGGKVYPYSDSASAVLDVLRRAADGSGVETVCGFDVKTVERTKNGSFAVIGYSGQRKSADCVVVACGGKAAPDLGSCGAGYAILKQFGHTITELSPSLVQIKTDTEIVRKLKGIKIASSVRLGSFMADGELLFTDYGLSGPPIFSLSSRLGSEKYLLIDIMPEYSFSDVSDMLGARAKMLCDVPLEDFFTGMLNKRVGQAILKTAGAAPLSRPSGSLAPQELKKIASAIKGWRFEIKGTMSWNNAQVTKGGADTSRFDPRTMESLLVRGLYACGEVLDIDGDCGGFNLQWAWSSGYIAGTSAAGG